MNRSTLVTNIFEKRSFLCVGLDPDLTKIPKHLLSAKDPIFEFNKAIIDATLPYAVAYKPNLAFYEAEGIKGLKSLKKTMDYLHKFEVFTIADAKRGDIGNSSAQYAKAFLSPEGDFNFDAITIAPYMGEDSITPFFAYPDKWAILLALTSNKGADDFQKTATEMGEFLFLHVIDVSQHWGTTENLMYVLGATQDPGCFSYIRVDMGIDNFLLVPGVGAQGGELKEICRSGMLEDCGLIVNASRSILYAYNGKNFAKKAAEEARKLQKEMDELLKKYAKKRKIPID